MRQIRPPTILLLTALAVVSVPLATGASAARTSWPSCSATQGWSVELLQAMARSGDLRSKLFGKICGPHRVVRGVNNSYTVAVTNIGDTNDRVLKLVLSHYDPLARTSLPFRREPAGSGNGDPLMRVASGHGRTSSPVRASASASRCRSRSTTTPSARTSTFPPTGVPTVLAHTTSSSFHLARSRAATARGTSQCDPARSASHSPPRERGSRVVIGLTPVLYGAWRPSR